MRYNEWEQDDVDLVCGGDGRPGADVVIFNPVSASLTPTQLAQMQACSTKLICYLSVGEDARGGIPHAVPKDDGRVPQYGCECGWANKATCLVKDGSMCRKVCCGRGAIVEAGGDEAAEGLRNGSMVYPSYYMDGNAASILPDGKPDRNSEWGGFFVNASDDAWWDVLLHQEVVFNEVQGAETWDGFAGLKVLLETPRSKGGYMCDGLFLDTLDTVAPTSFEVGYGTTAPGMVRLIARIRDRYPDKAIVANRGLFFFDPRMETFTPEFAKHIDALVVESFLTDSDPDHGEESPYGSNNRFLFAPLVNVQVNQYGMGVIALEYTKPSVTPAHERYANNVILHELGWSLLRTNRDIHQKGFFDARSWLRDHGGVDVDPPTWENTDPKIWLTDQAHVDHFRRTSHQGIQRAWGEKATPRGGNIVIYVAWDVAVDQTLPVRFNVDVARVSDDQKDGGRWDEGATVVLSVRHAAFWRCKDWGKVANSPWNKKHIPVFPHCFSINTSADGALRCGRRYRVRVRAEDGNGNEDENEQSKDVTVAC